MRELAIGHVQPGLSRIYDRFAYLDEKAALFEAWARRLRAIVTVPPENVVPLTQRPGSARNGAAG